MTILKDAINELCWFCGDFKNEHKGACDNCKWYGIKYEIDDGVHYAIEQLPERLKAARMERGLTRKELAKKAGITVKGIYNMEAGRNYPRLDTLVIVCNALDLSIDQLLRK